MNERQGVVRERRSRIDSQYATRHNLKRFHQEDVMERAGVLLRKGLGVMEKRKIKASEVSFDIRNGLSYEDLRQKYNLNEANLDKILTRLVSIGDIRKDQIPSEGTIRLTVRCPACGKPQSGKSEECPDCGVITTKWADLKSKQAPPIESPQIQFSGSPVPDSENPAGQLSVGSQVKVLAGFLAVLAVILLVIVNIMMSPGTQRAKSYNPAPLIQVEVKSAVKARMKDPSSAQFSDFRVWELKDSEFHYAFMGNVRGKNSFGAYVLNVYSGKCRCSPEKNSVEIETLDIYY